MQRLARIVGVAVAWWASVGLAAVPGKLGIYRFPDELARAVGITTAGAAVYRVAPSSPAKNVGIQPGDVIVALDGAAIASFDELLQAISGKSPGTVVELEFLRGKERQTVKPTLALWVSDLSDASYKASLEFLESMLGEKDGPEVRHAIVDNYWQLGDRRRAVQSLEEAIVKFPQEHSFKSLRLDYLQKSGNYEAYCSDAIKLADAFPPIVELQLEKAEALIATGRLAEAEQICRTVAIQTAKSRDQRSIHHEAISKWVTTRIRLGRPLADRELDAALDPKTWQRPALAVMGAWKNRLKDKPIYQLADPNAKAEVPLDRASVLLGLVPNKMHGIAIKVNGIDVPLAIVDTGASHTLLGNQIASEAGVWIGTQERAASGSLAFTARPGVVDSLQIGDVTLRNVPVSVGNPPPLVMTKAKAALGVDLMHHLRFVIDYPKGKVFVEAADAPDRLDGKAEYWDIPLWTFTDHVLSMARTSDGAFARTLIDSGNFAQTLVWPQWAKQHVANHPGPTSSMLMYGFRNPQRSLEGLELGGVRLPKWPIMDIPPITLQGVDLLDLLMGHDLLSQYRVTIDMKNRRLRLESPGGKLQKPKPPRPFMT